MFPSAGLGPSMFMRWTRLIPTNMEQCITQLPGRESRWTEAPFVNLRDLVHVVADVVEREIDRPFAFFGHSLGALLGFEVVRLLRAQVGLEPWALFVAGLRAPQLPTNYVRIADLPDPEFIAALNERHEGVPAGALDNHELMDLVLPTLKTDYRMFERYEYTTGSPLTCPISVFGGSHDAFVPRKDLECWREQTTSTVTIRMLPGGHFFVNDHAETIVAHMLDDLRR